MKTVTDCVDFNVLSGAVLLYRTSENSGLILLHLICAKLTVGRFLLLVTIPLDLILKDKRAVIINGRGG